MNKKEKIVNFVLMGMKLITGSFPKITLNV